MNDDAAATVRALLGAAGITPPEEEVQKMIQSYPSMRAAADGMFSDAISRHDPVFLPTAPRTDDGGDAR